MKEDNQLVLVWSDVIHCQSIHSTRLARVPWYTCICSCGISILRRGRVQPRYRHPGHPKQQYLLLNYLLCQRVQGPRQKQSPSCLEADLNFCYRFFCCCCQNGVVILHFCIAWSEERESDKITIKMTFPVNDEAGLGARRMARSSAVTGELSLGRRQVSGFF